MAQVAEPEVIGSMPGFSTCFDLGHTLSLLRAGVGKTLFDATLLVPAYNTGLMRPFETKNLGKVFVSQ